MSKKKVKSQDPLDSWDALNKVVMKATEDECVELLKKEEAGRNRTSFKLRIHSRINKLRADRERDELKS